MESASTLILLLMDLPEYGILSDQSKEIKRKLAVGVGATVKKKNTEDALVALGQVTGRRLKSLNQKTSTLL